MSIPLINVLYIFCFLADFFWNGLQYHFRKSDKIHLVTFKIHLFLYKNKNLPPWSLDLFPNDSCFKNKDTSNSRVKLVKSKSQYTCVMGTLYHLLHPSCLFHSYSQHPSLSPHFPFPDLCLLSNVFLMINYAHYYQDHLLKA